MRVRLTDIRDHSIRELDLSPVSCDMSGWQSGVAGWSIGAKGSGAPIELDEPLGECHVGVFAFRYQLLLWGQAKELPEVWLFPQGRPGSLVPFEPSRWLLTDREDLGRVAMGGDVRLRFDQSPIRFGHYILESLQAADGTAECCAFCNEPLNKYFRVGSQQACPSCTQEFKQDLRANLAKSYWRALGLGLTAAALGGLIHGVLLTVANVSFGSILIGALVGLAMRIFSANSSGLRYRVTAAVLTFLAGTLESWRGYFQFESKLGDGIITSAVYLAAGMLAAWMLSTRNVRTEIHGPFLTETFRGS